MEPIIFLILWFLKRLFLMNSFGELLSEEIVANEKLQENVVYMGLENIESRF